MACGGQAISCGCKPEEYADLPDDVWTGRWPGEADAVAFGWFCKRNPHGPGWVPCEESDPEATPDLNRLHIDATWNKKTSRWVKKNAD